MSKVLDIITWTPLQLVDKQVGQIVQSIGIIAIGAATGNPALIAYGLGRLASQLAPTPKPPTTTSSIKDPIPPRIRAYGELRLYGAWILFGNKADGTPVDAWAFHDGQANQITQIYLNNDKITRSGDYVQPLADGSYKGDRLRCGYSLGLPTETAFPTLLSEIPEVWTSNHRGDGVVTGYLVKYLVKAEKFQEVYPNGDNIQMSLAGQWSLVFDFRDEAQDAADPATWVYSDNAVLAFCHYLITQRGVDYTTQILPQIDKWTAAADVCDETMSLAAGGTEKRYRASFAYKATDQPASIIAGLLATFDGWYCVNERNELIVYAGDYYEPTVSITPAQIVAYRFQEYVPAEDAVNEITVQYVSSLHDYNTVDAQAWRDEDAIAESGRQPVSIELGAQIPSFTQGRRLAKRKMIQANAPQRGTVSTTYSGRAALGERYINLRIEEAGAIFFDGVAEIISSPERDMQTGGVRFEWIAADSNIDDWDAPSEDGYGAPVGETITVIALEEPVITSLTISNDDDSGSNSIGARLLIEATGPDRDDLSWLVRWRVKDTTLWQTESHPDTADGATVELLTGFVPVDSLIEVQISYLAGDGRRSPWSTPTSEIDTTTTPMLTEDGEEMLTEDGATMIEG